MMQVRNILGVAQRQSPTFHLCQPFTCRVNKRQLSYTRNLRNKNIPVISILQVLCRRRKGNSITSVFKFLTCILARRPLYDFVLQSSTVRVLVWILSAWVSMVKEKIMVVLLPFKYGRIEQSLSATMSRFQIS